MRRAVDQLIEVIQFAGVAVAFVGVVVTVVRAAMASLSGDRSRRVTDIGLDLARIVLVGIDLMLVSAILQVALTVNEENLTRLGTVAALRVGLTLLIAFEDAFRADTTASSRGSWSRKALGWRAPAPRPPGQTRETQRPAVQRHAAHRSAPAEPLTGNVWTDRARLGRD